MLKKMRIFAAALALGGLLFGAGEVEAAKGFRDLMFVGNYMERHPTVTKVWKPLFAKAEKAFDGRLSFDYYAANVLYPEAEGPMAVGDGRVDFACLLPAVYPGRFNLLGVMALPGLVPDAITGSLLMEDLIRTFPEIRAEMPENTVHFTAWTSAAYQIHTLNPVKSLKELEGCKIIAWDATCIEMMKALGANPIRVNATDTYMALSKGMADGVICPLAPLRSFKITEATRHHLMLNVFVQGFMMEANKSLWDDMPEDMKAFLSKEGSMTAALAVGRSLEDGVKADTVWMEGQGHAFYPLPEEEKALFAEKTRGFVELWRKDCRSLDPALVDKVYDYARKRSAFYASEVKAGTYDAQGK